MNHGYQSMGNAGISRRRDCGPDDLHILYDTSPEYYPKPRSSKRKFEFWDFDLRIHTFMVTQQA